MHAHPSRRHFIAGASALLASAGVGAQERFPSRAITLVVPFGAGGGPDIYCRRFAQKLEQVVGQTVVVANRPGANSIIGTNSVAKARPDGYTLLYATNSSLSAAPGMFKNLPYDPVKDFAGVTMIAQSYFALLVHIDDKAVTLPQMIERMRKDPAKHAVAGGSSTQEVINKQLQSNAKTDATYIRYKEASQMMTDLLGGRLGIAIAPMSQALQFIHAGKVGVIAVTSPQRLPSLPQVPTMAETFPGIYQETWTGLFVPAGTPREVIDALNRAAMKVFDDPDVRQLSEDGGRQFRTTPAEADAFVKKEVPRWAELLKMAGIEPG